MQSQSGSSWSSRVLLCICIALVAYAAAMGVRAYEAPLWDSPHYRVEGQVMQATHDAYFYLAGAKDKSRDPDRSLAQITSAVHSVTGIHYSTLGFWMPVFLAPLTVLPIVLLGWIWRLEEGALPAAVLAATSSAFLMRSRVGFHDTEALNLFFPLLVCALLIFVFSPYLRGSWSRKSAAERELKPASWQRFLFWCLLTGLVGWAYMWFDSGKAEVLIATLAALAAAILLLSRNWWHAGYMAVGLLLILAVSLAGWVGLLTAAAFAALILAVPRITARPGLFLPYLILLSALVLWQTELHGQVSGILQSFLSYARLLPVEEEAQLALPTVAQSVREVQPLDPHHLVSRIAGSWLIFIPALAGLGYVLYRFPVAIILLPMLLLGVLSFQLGTRFAMYAAPVLGIGLGFGVCLALRHLVSSVSLRLICMLAIAALAFLPAWERMHEVHPSPVISSTFAQTYLDLRDNTEENARLWQWWDFGYAAQYYAERITYSDGGHRPGPVLYTLARAHATHSPRQASQLMHYVTRSQEREYEQNPEEYRGMPQFWKPYLVNPIASGLGQKEPEEAMSFMRSLAEQDKDFSQDLPPQYLVLTWQNLDLAYWISFFGNWDLASAEASPGQIRQVRAEARLDSEEGVLMLQNRQLPLQELILVREEGIDKEKWPNESDIYAVLNDLSGQLYIMDGKMYNSMFIQMLLADPEEFSEHFRLVKDEAPWVRAYKAR